MGLTTMAAQGAQKLQKLRADASAAWRQAGTDLFARDITKYLPEDLQHRVVWVVPEDALADGWRVDDDDEQDVSRDVDIRLRTEEVMTQAAGLARLGDGHTHGGSFVWVVYAGDTSYALPAREGAEVVRLHAVSCTELRPTKWEADPTSDRFGQPVSYQLTMQRGGMAFAGVEVHASRLVYVPGLRRARTREETDSEAGRDWSALRVYREAIQGLDQGWRSSGRLLERRAIPAVEFADALGSRAGDDDASGGLKAAIAMFRDSFTVDKIAVMLGGSKLSWLAPAVSGTSELLATMGWRMASVEGIPLTKLFGQPPGGLSTDDASATATYNALLNRTRRKVYTGVLLDLYARILGPNVARRVEWPALDEPTDKERAETSLIRAQRDVALVTAGIWTERESRARYTDGEEVDLPILDDAEWEGEMLPTLDEPGTPEGVPGGVGPDAGVKAQDTALNGAQVTSALAIVQAVVDGTLTRAMAEAMLAEFFNMPAPNAARLLEGVEDIAKPEAPIAAVPTATDRPPGEPDAEAVGDEDEPPDAAT